MSLWERMTTNAMAINRPIPVLELAAVNGFEMVNILEPSF